jgi:hypothetical protein
LVELPENHLRESFALSACVGIPVLGFVLIALLVWKFTRSAVRSGVQQANARTIPVLPQVPPPVQPPQHSQPLPPSDEHIRRIVREELKSLLAARAAAKAKPGSSG